MKIKMIRAFVLFSALFFLGALTVSADTTGSAPTLTAPSPSVTSFTASPMSINYGYSTVLSWTISNGSGHDLYFTCPTGVIIKRDDGSIFPCNTKQSVSTNASDSATFQIANFTGSSVVIPVKVTPKDSNGTDYDAASSSLSLYVGAVPFPITDFSYATSTAATSSTPITLAWIGLETPGTNIVFSCKDGLQVFPVSPAQTSNLVCGQPAYTTDLPTSGFASVYFVNNNTYSVDETVNIFPTISAGVYDATHAKSITFTIPAKPIPGVPAITSFSSSQTLLASGQSINFSWSANNTSGVNLQMPCQNAVSWNNVLATTTVPLPCGIPAFSPALSATGSSTISFVNNTISQQPVSVQVYPQNTDGTYDATKVRTVNLQVLEPGHIQAPITTTQPVQVTSTLVSVGATSTSSATGTSGIKAIHAITFSVSMKLGSRSSQVSALQTFLKQDPSLYPEGLVTGYMGPATVAAIKRFQQRYGVANPGDAGYGLVGPLTRAKLNSILNF